MQDKDTITAITWHVLVERPDEFTFFKTDQIKDSLSVLDK